jgi:aldehyde:ferredoxin oxidoreductase
VCDVNDWGSIIAYHDFTNEYGIDAMELGLTLGMLMKWYEAGIINKDTLNGVELTWGNMEAILAMAHNVVYRKGFGDIVSGGLRRTCEQMKMSDYGPPGHIKGVAFSGAGYDYRLSNIRALYYCTSPRGSDHLKGHVTFENAPSPEVAEKLFGSREILKPTSEDPAKGKVVKFHEDLYGVLHSAGLCLFGYFWFQIYDLLTMTKILNAATGWTLTEQEMCTTGERIFNMMKSYNARLGLTREDDHPPKWFRKTAVQWDVPAKGYVLNLDPLLDGYYDARGWDKETSWPTQRKLEELDLKDVAVDMANWHHAVRERTTS